MEKGVRFSGCTVHFVNNEVDGVAIILQEAVPVYFEDDAESLQKRILEEEHKILPKAIKLILEKKVKIIDSRVFVTSPMKIQTTVLVKYWYFRLEIEPLKNFIVLVSTLTCSIFLSFLTTNSLLVKRNAIKFQIKYL